MWRISRSGSSSGVPPTHDGTHRRFAALQALCCAADWTPGGLAGSVGWVAGSLGNSGCASRRHDSMHLGCGQGWLAGWPLLLTMLVFGARQACWVVAVSGARAFFLDGSFQEAK